MSEAWRVLLNASLIIAGFVVVAVTLALVWPAETCVEWASWRFEQAWPRPLRCR